MMDLSRESMLAEYRRLCAERDAAYARTAPLELELAAANAAAEAARLRAAELAGQIDDTLGREKWIDLKYRIGVLARALGSVPHEVKA